MERSQQQNKRLAMSILTSKIEALEQAKRDEELKQAVGDPKNPSWGNQIRSYVFQPYTLVKDHRTGLEVGNVQAVMDGHLDPYINAYLRWDAARSGSGNRAAARPTGGRG